MEGLLISKKMSLSDISRNIYRIENNLVLPKNFNEKEMKEQMLKFGFEKNGIDKLLRKRMAETNGFQETIKRIYNLSDDEYQQIIGSIEQDPIKNDGYKIWGNRTFSSESPVLRKRNFEELFNKFSKSFEEKNQGAK